MGLIVKCEIVYRGAERAHSLLRFSLTYAAISFCSLEWDELWAAYFIVILFGKSYEPSSAYINGPLSFFYLSHVWCGAPKPLSIFAIVFSVATVI